MKNKLPDRISIGHGSGGSMTRSLIENLFAKEFGNNTRQGLTDSALVETGNTRLAYTTDSYVVDPLFFPGGNIGKLAVCGTVNDLAVSGARPLYLSTGFIIEEGLEMEVLRKIVKSMASEAKKAGVRIITGDTKVVNHGKCDKLFINTSGIGVIDQDRIHISMGSNVRPGDKIIVNGNLGDHSIAILSSRSEIEMDTSVISDCASLNGMIGKVLDSGCKVNFIRDATRGGAATVLVEVSEMTGHEITLEESLIPISPSVEGVCEILGFDPLYLANEGKIIMIVAHEDAERAIDILKTFPEGKDARIIGEVSSHGKKRVNLITAIGGTRIVDIMASDQLPRIC